MTEKPKLHAYAVALCFADGGPLSCNVVIADTPQTAAAIWATATARMLPDETRALTGVQVTPIEPEFLEQAIRAERGGPTRPIVVPMVPDEPGGAA